MIYIYNHMMLHDAIHIYIYIYLSLYIYIGKRLEVPRNAIQVHCLQFWKMSFFTVFYSVLCSFHNLITYGISSTCGQHTWDMLFTIWRFLFFKRFSSSSFYVVFVETGGFACWFVFFVFWVTLKCHNPPDNHGQNAREVFYSSHPQCRLKAFSTFST